MSSPLPSLNRIDSVSWSEKNPSGCTTSVCSPAPYASMLYPVKAVMFVPMSVAAQEYPASPLTLTTAHDPSRVPGDRPTRIAAPPPADRSFSKFTVPPRFRVMVAPVAVAMKSELEPPPVVRERTVESPARTTRLLVSISEVCELVPRCVRSPPASVRYAPLSRVRRNP